jgi:hypothetical protein
LIKKLESFSDTSRQSPRIHYVTLQKTKFFRSKLLQKSVYLFKTYGTTFFTQVFLNSLKGSFLIENKVNSILKAIRQILFVEIIAIYSEKDKTKQFCGENTVT